jgi:hypothetical protein
LKNLRIDFGDGMIFNGTGTVFPESKIKKNNQYGFILKLV